MAKIGIPQETNGWTQVPDAGLGFPDVERVSLAPLVDELQELAGHALRTLAMNPDDPMAKAVAFVVERLRRRTWQASAVKEEASPAKIAKLLDGRVTADTIRNWCNAGHVKHRRVGTRYLVDVDSALRYAAKV